MLHNFLVWMCSRMGGHRAAAHALIQRGKEHARQMDVRAAVRSYEVHSAQASPSWPPTKLWEEKQCLLPTQPMDGNLS